MIRRMGMPPQKNRSYRLRPGAYAILPLKTRFLMTAQVTPEIDVHPETYEVRADGELLTCEPAAELPMAQRYFLF